MSIDIDVKSQINFPIPKSQSETDLYNSIKDHVLEVASAVKKVASDAGSHALTENKTLSTDTNTTFSDLSAGSRYRIIYNFSIDGSSSATGKIYPNGTLSTKVVTHTLDYNAGTVSESAGDATSEKLSENDWATGDWVSGEIELQTRQDDASVTMYRATTRYFDGTDIFQDTVTGYIDSNADFSSVTLGFSSGTTTLTGTATLYKYNTS